MAFLLAGAEQPAILYDNHHPKGHHRHRGRGQEPYEFSSVDQLLVDFRTDVRMVKATRKESG